MTINKVVIPAAGLGTRLLTITKETPKEMLPLYALGSNGKPCMKPVLQLIFEQLFDVGFREFCFIVGRGKRSIEDHFTPDYGFVELLKKKGNEDKAKNLEEFYGKIEKSTMVWVNQPVPRGFGHAILLAEPFVGDELFLVHAGDTYIESQNHDYLRRLISCHIRESANATLVLKKVTNPAKLYGVAEIQQHNDAIKVKRVLEKPEKPPTDLAIMPIYTFNKEIFKALKATSPAADEELQLTDGIQTLIDWILPVRAIKLERGEDRLDVGTPEVYWKALSYSFKHPIK